MIPNIKATISIAKAEMILNKPIEKNWSDFTRSDIGDSKYLILNFSSIPVSSILLMNWEKYHPRGAGGTHSPPAMPHQLQNPKELQGGPKMADGVRKRLYR